MNMSENQRALQRENSRLRMQRIQQGDNLPLPKGTCFEEDQIPLHLCGQLDQVCPKCRAKYFELEQTTYSKTFHKCCSKGKVELEPIQTSELLESLMTGKHQLSKNFMENIRSVNSALAFASMGQTLHLLLDMGPIVSESTDRFITAQTLPVVPHGTQAAIVDSSIKFHPLWKKFNILKLDNNIRSIDPEFSAWLLKLGNGELTNDLGLDSDTFEIPSEIFCNGDLVKEIYGDKLLPSDFEQYTDKAILCPRNVEVDDINNRVLDILEGLPKVTAIDRVVCIDRQLITGLSRVVAIVRVVCIDRIYLRNVHHAVANEKNLEKIKQHFKLPQRYRAQREIPHGNGLSVMQSHSEMIELSSEIPHGNGLSVMQSHSELIGLSRKNCHGNGLSVTCSHFGHLKLWPACPTMLKKEEFHMWKD
ncbi:hypothetical protein LAZ67_2000442 [Cordylochernes scorpioides]|uniref:ATP-dependent DNA helicase n=1 Tax=Cordylochernes scorpioides TaxID=51811 RepID=A0ABY6K1B4_9ARAC|nr:hypothetical protein LAZ67_2000442 [Cordylochernes scorpioides]